MMVKADSNHKVTKDTKRRRPKQVTARIFAWFTLCSLGLCGWVSPAPAGALEPERMTLTLPASPAEDAARALSSLLGAEVAVEGAVSRRAAVQVTAGTPAELLDRVAAAYSGAWVPVYTVTIGRESEEPPPQPRSGRSVTLRVQKVPARAALQMVARAAGARLRLSESLWGTVTLEGETLSVEEAMQRVTAQVGATWRTSYALLVPEPPAAPAPTVETPAAPSVESLSPPVSITPPPGTPSVPARPALVLGVASLRTALTADLARLLQTDPNVRRPAVEQYAARLESLLNEVAPAGRPRPQLAPLRPYFRSGLRAFRGLTPDQQDEFRPVFDLLKRWMP
jgi:hypothetical protein